MYTFAEQKFSCRVKGEMGKDFLEVERDVVLETLLHLAYHFVGMPVKYVKIGYPVAAKEWSSHAPMKFPDRDKG